MGTTQRPIQIRLSDYNFYCCKHDKTEPKYFLLKELLASKFLTHLGIDTPDIVLVDLDDDHVVDLNDRPTHLYDLVGFKWIDNAQEIDRYTEIKKDRIAYRSIFLRILLFDIWILNSDRIAFNANMIIQRQSKHDIIIPIDHGMAFYSAAMDDFHVFFQSTLELGRNGSLLSIPSITALLKGTKNIKELTNQVIDDFKSSIFIILDDLDNILDLVPESWHIDCSLVKNILLDTIFSSDWHETKIIEQFLLYLKQSNIIK